MGVSLEFRLIAAARHIGDDFPYYYPAVTRLRFRKDNENTPTMSINCSLVIYYNEEFVKNLNHEELRAVVLHEILHYINGHHARYMNNSLRKTLPFDIHNIAMDIEVNEFIKDLPKDSYRAKDFDFPERKSYEEYLLLIDKINKEDIKDKGIMPADDLNLNGYSNEYHDILKELIEECRRSERSMGAEYAVSDTIRRIPKRKYRWEQVFQNILAAKTTEVTAGYRYRTFEKANRRYVHTPDIILPVFIDRKIKISLAIVMDISGSMGDLTDKMYGIMKSMVDILDLVIDITILEVSMGVENIIRGFDLQRETVESMAGGGTDMGAGLNYIYDTNLNPDLIVVMTDSYTPWPDPPILADKTVVLTDNPVSYDGPYPMYPVEFDKPEKK